jgi:hypothetical protein
MSDYNNYKGQAVAVEGSVTGDFFTDVKLDYQGGFNLIYLGECKTPTEDSYNRHFIQQFVYTNNLLTSVPTASNKTTLGCTSFNMDIVNNKIISITLNNGDFTEINIGDNFILVNSNFNIIGTILKINSPTNAMVTVITDTSLLTPVSNVTINATDLTCHLEHSTTKDWTKRRWDHRTRYIYI